MSTGKVRVLGEYLIKGLVALLSLLIIYISFSLLGFSYADSLLIAVAYTLSLVLGSLSRISITDTLSINIGGAIVPALTVIVLAATGYSVLGGALVIAPSLVLALIVYSSTKLVEGKGIGVQLLIPVIGGSATAALYIDKLGLNPLYSIPIGYITGVVGVLLGADVLKAIPLSRRGLKLEIGGEGVLDLVVLASTLIPSITQALLIIASG